MEIDVYKGIIKSSWVISPSICMQAIMTGHKSSPKIRTILTAISFQVIILKY